MPDKRIEQYIESHKEEMLEDLKCLVRINSVRSEAKEGKPYGEGPALVLKEAAELIAGYGFAVKNYENQVITADFSDQEKQLDILAHLDVVPVSPEDWTVTAPFEPVVQDGRIYGRGTADDKGPAIAALYAMRAIRECGIPLSKNVRLILGADEECGSGDLEYYYSIEQEAPMSFTPDAHYPVINLEKGHLYLEFSGEIPESGDRKIAAFHAGTAANIVPAKSYAVLRGVEKSVVQGAIERDESGVTFTVREQDGGLRIDAQGLAAHASTPEAGNNAICGLVELLTTLPLGEGAERETWKAIAELFPRRDTRGAALGVEMKDEISGALTLNLGILHFEGTTLTAKIDSRVPVCGGDENVTAVLKRTLTARGFRILGSHLSAPHYVPEDSELVQVLLRCYEDGFGKPGKALAIGGGTYVHHLQNGVAFGCEMEGVDNHMHGDDEFMELEVLFQSAVVFADAILRLCR